MTMLTHTRLLDVLHYDPATGEFRWKITAGSRAIAGQLAGSPDGEGYLVIMIDGTLYRVHVLAFLYMTGRWPESTIDHRDNDTMNTRWENLREASMTEQRYNSRKSTRNKSGHKNVCWEKNVGKWAVRISTREGRKHLGYFDDLELAALVASEARDKYHGEFANHG